MRCAVIACIQDRTSEVGPGVYSPDAADAGDLQGALGSLELVQQHDRFGLELFCRCDVADRGGGIGLVDGAAKWRLQFLPNGEVRHTPIIGDVDDTVIDTVKRLVGYVEVTL